MVLDIYAYAQLFGGDSPYEDDDREADKIYQAIDDRMDSRRKRRYGPFVPPQEPLRLPLRDDSMVTQEGRNLDSLRSFLAISVLFSAILGTGARSNSWRA
jgi:hypothetical protein